MGLVERVGGGAQVAPGEMGYSLIRLDEGHPLEPCRVAASPRHLERPGAEIEAGVQVAAVDPEPRGRVEEAADEPLVGDALGQPQSFLECVERRLELPDAGARDTFAPEAPDQGNEQTVLAADLDPLAGDGSASR